jgi:colanic acid biosynthesis protein WcaH
MSVPPANRRIPDDLYREILRSMPIACVDVVIPSVAGVLLVKRKNEPAKGQWWIPGGRVWKGEPLATCAERHAKEEVGLDAKFQRILHVEETIFDTGPWNVAVHSINVCILLSMMENQSPVIDGDHSSWRWLRQYNEISLHPYVTRCLEAAGPLLDGPSAPPPHACQPLSSRTLPRP